MLTVNDTIIEIPQYLIWGALQGAPNIERLARRPKLRRGSYQLLCLLQYAFVLRTLISIRPIN